MATGRIYPVGMQTFSEIIERGMVYVDKTDLVYRLVKKYKYVFLSRPRRFGKSLLGSTLHSYFEGRRELFAGLKLANLEHEWLSYPVLHLDMSILKNHDALSSANGFDMLLGDYEAELGIARVPMTPGGRLMAIIKGYAAKTGRRAVVIIDEYDAPLLEVLHDDAKLERARITLQEFYSPLKTCDPYIQFAFITGITQFSQLSIFSTINNLANVSMEKEFSAICGITKTELSEYLSEDVRMLAEENNLQYDEMRNVLEETYDGYHFCKGSDDIFNPFSLMRAFSSRAVANYWFASGTPTYLIQQMRHFNTDVTSLDNVLTYPSAFDRPTEAMTDALPLLYQSGYLTIKDYDPLSGGYYLGIPNKEVRTGLMENLLPLYTNISDSQSLGFAAKFYHLLLSDQIDDAMLLMRAYFASIPYPEGGKEVLTSMQKSEYYYETLLYVVLSLMNVAVSTQVKSCRGRADAVMHTPNATFLFEVKINGSAKEALRQIDDKGYAIPYTVNGHKVVKVGVNFSTSTRTIEDWAVSSVS